MLRLTLNSFIHNSYKMYTIQLRNLPKDIYDGIKKAAEDSRRSMTQEVILAIENHLANKQNQKDELARKKELLSSLVLLHDKTPLPNVGKIKDWIEEGRK
ncbi:MAG: hypothetical protein KDC49_03760 [Saprospiraceae bacterium]|nr:hypothetical protein [Saprospiraceae bacterium]